MSFKLLKPVCQEILTKKRAVGQEILTKIFLFTKTRKEQLAENRKCEQDLNCY